MSIAQRHQECYSAFQDLCDAAQGSERHHDGFSDEFDKYTLWAGNVGAAHSGTAFKLSLDYRLREASAYKDQVFKLLEILKLQVGKACQILKGERIPFEELSSDSDSDSRVSSQLGAEAPDVEEDSPWEVSSDSETELSIFKTGQPRTQAPKEKPSTISAVLPARATSAEKTPGVTELQQLLESVKLTVTCLYKLPLRKPAPIDRLSDQSTEELSYYQNFDISYVRDKFPDKRLDAQIIMRLGKMITRRRQLFLYRKRHSEKLRTDVAVPSISPAGSAEERRRIATKTSDEAADAGGSDLQLANNTLSQPEGSHITFQTKASTLRVGEIPPKAIHDLFAPSVAESESRTSLAASEATRDIRVEVPPRPSPERMTGFKCKYCFLTPYIRSDHAWKKHVLNDLQPYVCTHTDCNVPNHLFENRDAWYSHETRHHRVELFCNTAGHEAYGYQRDFESHMKQEHDMITDASSAILDAFRRPVQSLDGLCNLCFRETKNLKSHLSRHLQQVALFAVPRADYSVDDETLDDNSDISQNNARGSRSEENQDVAFGDSDGNSEVSGDQASVTEDAGVGNYEAYFEESVEQVGIPDTEDPDWDAITDKFSMARAPNHSKPASIENLQDSGERQAIYDWLSPFDYVSQHDAIIANHQKGTGMWFLQSNEFQQWINQSNQTLFCPGMPGAGKTILTSIAIDHIYSKFGDHANIGIAYLYYSFRKSSQQEALNQVGSLLRQLVQQRPSMPDNVKRRFDHWSRGLRPYFEEIWDMLQSVIGDFSRTFIIIDGLDEFRDYFYYRGLQSAVFNLQMKTGVNLFVTSRFTPENEIDFQGCLKLEIRATEEDVRTYLEGNISQLSAAISKSHDLQEAIITKILNSVDGSFLLARLWLGLLVDKSTLRTIKTLQYLPSDLKEVYSLTMERIHNQRENSVLAKSALSWIAYSKRPLTALKLRHALAAETGDSKFHDDKLPEIRDIVSMCAGLITVDKDSDIIDFFHYTARECFEGPLVSLLPNAQSKIALTCVTYLSFDAFEEGACATDGELQARLGSYPLYDYAARNWGDHARATSGEVDPLTLSFLESESKVAASGQVLMMDEFGLVVEALRGFTGVHLAAHLGLREAMASLLDRGYNFDIKSIHGQTPLSRAVKNGHEAVVELLIKKGANMESKDEYDQTPLSRAARIGLKAVTKLLIEKGADLESKDWYGQTPLWWAAFNGHEAVAKLLIEKGADLESKDKNGQTPLSRAARSGYEAVAKLLIKKGADLESKDGNGQTPLWWAIENGHEAVVKVLVERGADLESPDENGQTPLLWAADNGLEAVVKLLIEKGVNIESKDHRLGRTPLLSAAAYGREKVVKLLVGEGADWTSKDKSGETPLSLAMNYRYQGIVEFLNSKTETDEETVLDTV